MAQCHKNAEQVNQHQGACAPPSCHLMENTFNKNSCATAIKNFYRSIFPVFPYSYESHSIESEREEGEGGGGSRFKEKCTFLLI